MVYKLLPTRVYRAYFGGQNLDRLENKNPEISRFPEDWLASTTVAFNPGRDIPDEGLSKIENGEYLKTVIDSNKKSMIGDTDKMSILCKLLDSSERLVIQVHPTVEFAKQYFNSEFGKTECWYILNDGGEIYIGFKEGITKEYWKKLFETQDIDGMLKCLHKFTVNKGDFVFVEGGVPHAIGKNCFLAEFQEPTDLMVIPERVTPSGVELSEQKLHCGLGFDKMFDCFIYEGLNEKQARNRFFKEPLRKNNMETALVTTDMTEKFRLTRIDVKGEYNYTMDSYGVAVVVCKKVDINGCSLTEGDRIFVPYNEDILNIKGDGTILICQP